MSARILASLTDERRHQRKQSGCINGIFQLFDHHQLLAGRRAGIHNHKRLLTGAQHQLEPLNAKNAVKAKHQEQQPKEKARWSTESPRTSYSSSSCSSKFSERSIQTTAVREQPQSQMNGPQSSDIRDVVKDSMYRDTSLQSIKSITNDARKVNVMKHIDSPRPRFSYDGRELREETTMKLKELPRLSLESKLNFLQRMEKDISSKPESHTRSSSIVAKLMGLDDFPDASPSPRVTFLSKSPRKAEGFDHQRCSPFHVNQCAGKRQNFTFQFHTFHAPRLFQSKPHEIAGEHIQYANHIQIQDHRYINKILLASGLLQDASIIPTANQLLSTRHLINPNMFHALEETEEANENLTENNDQVRSNQKIQRKIVFDVVNEILLHKIMSGTLFTMARKRTSPLRLVKEVYLQMDNLCRTSYCSTDDEDDGFTRLLSEDMKYQADGWTEYSGEIPALVLDIERLIFKELINEVVMGEFVALRDWPNRQCRQLFSK